MAVLGRLLVSSAERLDLPDLLSIDSYGAGDWKFFIQGLIGPSKPYILKGFDVIDPQNAIGTQSCSIRVADSVVLYPGSTSGPFYHGLSEGNSNALPLVPELRKNAINYVYLTFSTFNASVDTRAFWDPDKDGGDGAEFTQDVNTESVLKVEVNVSTGSFPANTVPIAKVTVGAVVITDIEDARDLMFRLGTGGISPNPNNNYNFRSLPSASYQRSEPPTIMSSPSDPNPFQGADKNILTLKEWMDVVMTKLKELGGTAFWYEDASTTNLINVFGDALATSVKSKGQWQHSSATPGLITWTEDINIKATNGTEDIIVRDGNKTLTNEQVMYVPLTRNQPINAFDQAVAWTNAQNYVNTIGGSIGLFANLAKGDWIKKITDGDHLKLRVEEFYDSVNLGGSVTTAANARSVRLNSTYQGSTANERARYNKGVYLASDVVVSDRNSSALTSLGGDFHWMAIRSDTIENVSTIQSFTLSGTLSEADGKTAKVSVTTHGLSDGDMVTVTAPAAQAGTYAVEVEDVNTFYIQTTNTTNGAFTAFYGLATTAARDNGYGLQLESANHNFNSGDTVIVAGTTNFNSAYVINKRTATQFQFAAPGVFAAEVTGTATLAKVVVRYQTGAITIIQGEIVDISGPDAQNIRNFVGMTSQSQQYPLYLVPPSYNTLDGMANYNGLVTDNLTVRVSKLTAMMADKAQDKTAKYLVENVTTVTNTTNGLAQEVTFTPTGGTLKIVLPGSDSTATISLPDSAPGISLLANQVAYVTVDRNAATSPTISIANIASLDIDENIFVIAVRLATTDIWLWDGSLIAVGSLPLLHYLNKVVQQNLSLKLVEGGTWFWDLATETLSWSADAFIQFPGLSNSDNEISTGSAVLTAGQVLYVDINRVAPGGVIAPTSALNSTLTLNTNRLVIARREGNDVIVGSHSFRLKDGERLELDGALAEINRKLSQLKIQEHETALNKVRILGADFAQLDDSTLSQELNEFLMSFTGAVVNFSTGTILEDDDLTALGVNFTPFSVPVGEYFWYGIAAIPAAISADNRQEAQIQITPATAANAVQASAPFPVLVGDKKLGAVQVFNNAGSIEVAAIRRLGTGVSSGTGTGDANTILETIKNRFLDSPFQLVTPNIAKVNKSDLIDATSAADYSPATRTFEFTAAQALLSTQLLDSNEFLNNTEAIEEVELLAFWSLAYLDTAATYEVSRNGGNEFQAVSMERVGNTELYRGVMRFTEEASNQVLSSNATLTTISALNATTQQKLAQSVVLANKSLIRSVDLDLNKLGSPSGYLYVSIYSDNAGDPDQVLSESGAIAMSGIGVGDSVLTVAMPAIYVTAGTYHIVLRTDSGYKSSFSAGVTQLAWRADGAASTPFLRANNGTVWSAVASTKAGYSLEGIVLDLRVRVTSSAGNKRLEGLGILYDKLPGTLVAGLAKREVFTFQAVADNDSTFTLTRFTPDPDLLKCYYIQSGQVFKFPAFQLSGQQVIFPANSFNNGGVEADVTLVFDQSEGSSFDNSDLNALLLADNHLGSPDPNLDKSLGSPGRGIYLRRPDGTLRELVVTNGDQVVVSGHGSAVALLMFERF